jgi:hypothetical protein
MIETGQARLAALREEEMRKEAARDAEAALKAQRKEFDRQDRERKDKRNAQDKQRRDAKKVAEQKTPSAAALAAQAANERAAKAVTARTGSSPLAATPSPMALSSPPPMSPSPMAAPKSKRPTGNTPSLQAGRDVAAATPISKNITTRPRAPRGGDGAGAIDEFGNEARPTRDSSSLGQSGPPVPGFSRSPSPALIPLPTPTLDTPVPETPPLGTPYSGNEDPLFK